jgi:hypothetical protein
MAVPLSSETELRPGSPAQQGDRASPTAVPEGSDTDYLCCDGGPSFGSSTGARDYSMVCAQRSETNVCCRSVGHSVLTLAESKT